MERRICRLKEQLPFGTTIIWCSPNLRMGDHHQGGGALQDTVERAFESFRIKRGETLIQDDNLRPLQ
jgi:hypothetical protein